MKVYDDDVLGHAVTVKVVENHKDAADFLRWCEEVKDQWVAIDVEATGLDIYSTSWRIRSVQFGTLREAWVLWVEGDYVPNRAIVQKGLDTLPLQLAHNRAYDAPALDHTGFHHSLWAGRDTMLMSHLLDSRGKSDGGVGHGLKALAAHYIDPTLTDSDDALKQWAKDQKIKVGERFHLAPTRLPELEHYAGMDCILTRGLHDVLLSRLTELDQLNLMEFEHEIQQVCSGIAAKGMLLDIPYAKALREHFLDREDILRQKMDEHGILNPNSVKQIQAALQGANLTLRTASGQLSVSKDALEGIDHPVAEMVQEFRHVTKFRVSYVDRCIDLVDEKGRVHPNIRSLQARTARMAVSDPPLQQLPASDALLRRMFIADPGMSICSVDYSQIELRVLAELAQEKAMLGAIAHGIDLHTNTAEKVGIDRKIAKMVNFLIVYGGGATKLEVSAAISSEDAVAAIRGFHKAFPGVKRYGNRLQERSNMGEHPVTTPSGRRLILDRDRTYAATNYVVQSTARDVLAEAMLDLNESPYASSMLLPVHDEILFQVPTEVADKATSAVVTIMSRYFGDTYLDATGDVYGPSWGHGYLDHGEIPADLLEWF